MPRRKQKGNLKAGHRYCRPYTTSKEPEMTPSSWGKWLGQDDFHRVAKSSLCGQLYTLTDAEGVYGTANLLHPKKEAAEELTQQYLRKGGQTVGTEEMKLFHQGKLSNMCNQAIAEHMTFEGKCEQPHFEVSSEQQRGICWRQALKCKNCQYKGGMHNLYAEVPSSSRGPKSCLLLIGAHMSPPGKSAMTRCAAK